MKALLCQVFLFCFLHGCNADTVEVKKDRPGDRRRFSELGEQFGQFISNVHQDPVLRPWSTAWWRQSGDWLSMYLPSLETNQTSEPCKEDLRLMVQELLEGTYWPLQMIDSWGKVPDGMLWGNGNADGSYDECLAIRYSRDEENFRGRYCSVSYSRPHNSNFSRSSTGNDFMLSPRVGQVMGTGPAFPLLGFLTYGTCMPSSCTQEDLQDSVTHALDGQLLSISCHTDADQPEFLAGDIVFITLCAVLFFLMLSAAAVDIFIDLTDKQHIRRGPAKFLLVFSLSTNFRKLFHISEESPSETISCIHGIRVLSIYWVIYGHQHFYNLMHVSNLNAAFNRTETFLFQILMNATISVDTFFLMSGLLVSYGIMRELQRTGRINVIMLYVHRLIRLTPPIAISCAITATVLRFLPAGPRSHTMDQTAEICRKYWWKDVLYVNNFLSYDDSNVMSDCIQPTWYTAVDTQLFLVAPILILPLHFRPSLGRGFLYLISLASVLIPAITVVVDDLTPSSFIFVGEGASDYMKKLYVLPWCRAGPWIVGIWTGYILFKQKQKRTTLKIWQVVAGWTVAVFVALAVLFGMYSYNQVFDPVEYDVMTQFFYGGFHRTVWALAVAWVIFACHSGYGGLVNSFLSYPAWQPLSRLTYTMFLMSVPVQIALACCLKTTIYVTYTNKIIETCGTLFVTGIVSVLVSLSVESPLLGLEKLIFRRS